MPFFSFLGAQGRGFIDWFFLWFFWGIFLIFFFGFSKNDLSETLRFTNLKLQPSLSVTVGAKIIADPENTSILLRDGPVWN